MKDNVHLLLEQNIDDKTYAVAEPGTEYTVKINIYRDNRGRFPVGNVRVGLFVDGVDVQYWKRIDLTDEALLLTDVKDPATALFFGFKENTSALRSFVFAIPKSTTDAVTAKGISLGTLKIDFFEAKLVDGVFHNQIEVKDVTKQQTVHEGTKFFEQASVTTTAGDKIHLEKEKFIPLPRWVNVSGFPLETMTIHYHTLETIKLLRDIHLDKQHGGGGIKRTFNDMTSSSSSSSSWSGRSQIVDLTSDDEGGEADDVHTTRDTSFTVTNPAVHREISIDHDISVLVMKPKKIPCLDISDEQTGPKWTTVTEQR